MPFLPIVERELRVASRRPRTYWNRAFVAGIALLIGGWMWMAMGDAPAARVGQQLFMMLSGTALIYCLLSGALTANSLSAEKREGTLGLLFLTDLKGHDVVLGKLAASALNAFFGFLGIFPVLAISMLLGGVSLRGFSLMMLVLVNTLLLSLCAGILVSSISRDERKSIVGTVFLMAFLAGGVFLIQELLVEYEYLRRGNNWIGSLSPVYPFVNAMDQVMGAGLRLTGRGRDLFWVSMGTLHLLAWVFLAIASWITPRVWQDRPAGRRKLAWRSLWQRWAFGDAIERQRFRRRLLEVNPICWLSSRERWKPAAAWAILGVAVAGWLYGYFKEGKFFLEAPAGMFLGMALHAVFKTWMASEVCRRFAEDRQAGALELVLSTPMTVREIVSGQWDAIWRLFWRPFVMILLIDGLLLAGALHFGSHSGNERSEIRTAFLLGMLVLILDFFALGWVGMWQGLSARNYSQAVGTTMAQILVGPWVFFWMLMILIESIGFRGRLPLNNVTFVMVVWGIIAVGADLLFGVRAATRLMHRFREVAMQRYQPKVQRRFWRMIWPRLRQPFR